LWGFFVGATNKMANQENTNAKNYLLLRAKTKNAETITVQRFTS
jgi:hypothetical protein